jgi:hypothetical protein
MTDRRNEKKPTALHLYLDVEKNNKVMPTTSSVFAIGKDGDIQRGCRHV